jgi:hypothetical protein
MLASIILPLAIGLQWTMKKEDQFYSTFDDLQILTLQKIKFINIHTNCFGHVMQA